MARKGGRQLPEETRVPAVVFELTSLGYTSDGSEISSILSAQDDTLQRMWDLSDGRWIELHYTGLPDLAAPWKSRVRIAVIAGLSSPHGGGLDDLAAAMDASLQFPARFYQFTIVDNPVEAATLARPFSPALSTELGSIQSVSGGEGSPARNSSPGDGVEFITLVRALLAERSRCRLRLAFRPTRLYPWEQQECERYLTAERVCAGSKEGQPASASGDDGPKSKVLGDLLGSRRRLFLSRAVIESEGPSPAATLSALESQLQLIPSSRAAAFSGEVWQESRAGTFRPLLPGSDIEEVEPPTPDLRRLSFLLTPEQARGRFRLPFTRKPEEGLPPRRPRFIPASEEIPVQGWVLGYNGNPDRSRTVALGEKMRFRHIHVMGQTGTGKSTFLHNLIMQDIAAGQQVCVIDPHGDLIDQVMGTMPANRVADVALFDPTQRHSPVGLNPLDCDEELERALICEEFLTIFHRTWPVDMVGPVFEYIVRNALLLAFHLGDLGKIPSPPTLLAFAEIVSGRKLLKSVRESIENPVLRDAADEIIRMASGTSDGGSMAYFKSKFDVLISRRDVRLIVGQPKTRFNPARIMEDGKILLIRLPVGELGEVTTRFLGTLLLMRLERILLGRSSVPAARRKPLSLYLDEFQNFVTESVPVLLAEGRKFGVRLILANQYLDQLRGGRIQDRLVDAILGNVGSLMSFRVGHQDAGKLSAYYGDQISPQDLVTLPNYQGLARFLGENGAPAIASVSPTPWPESPTAKRSGECRKASQDQYAIPRLRAERQLRREEEALLKLR